MIKLLIGRHRCQRLRRQSQLSYGVFCFASALRSFSDAPDHSLRRHIKRIASHARALCGIAIGLQFLNAHAKLVSSLSDVIP